MARDDRAVFRLLNRAPLFWNTNLSALQAGTFIVLGRIFDQQSNHNVDRLLKIAQCNPAIFSKAALGARKRAADQAAVTYIDRYLQDVYVPKPADFRHFRALVRKHRGTYEAKYRDLRHKIFAHKEVSDPAGVADAPRDLGEFSMFSPDAATSFDGNWELSAVPSPLPLKPKPIVHRSRQEICDTLAEAAQSNGVPAPFFIRLLFQESGFKPGVVSSAGAEGIAQFMPQTSADMGLDNPFDPLPAIRASARLLHSLVQQFGNLGLAAAAYNAGPKRITEWLAKKGKLPRETQGYVKSITGRPPEKWIIAEAGSPVVRLPRRAPCQEVAGLLAWNGPERIPLPPTHPPLGKPAHHIMTVVVRSSTKATRHAVQIAVGRHKSRRLQLSQR